MQKDEKECGGKKKKKDNIQSSTTNKPMIKIKRHFKINIHEKKTTTANKRQEMEEKNDSK